jgi:hypothetical protein
MGQRPVSAVGFTPQDAARIAAVVKHVERSVPPTGTDEAIPRDDDIPDWKRVIVAKDGGSDGTASTRASWTYTIKELDGSTTIATAVAVARARPLGPMEYGNEVASPAYGLAFHDGTNWKLWDAGETARLTALSPHTDFQVDDTNRKMQIKSRAVLVPCTASESGWTDKYTNGQACS